MITGSHYAFPATMLRLKEVNSVNVSNELLIGLCVGLVLGCLFFLLISEVYDRRKTARIGNLIDNDLAVIRESDMFCGGHKDIPAGKRPLPPPYPYVSKDKRYGSNKPPVSSRPSPPPAHPPPPYAPPFRYVHCLCDRCVCGHGYQPYSGQPTNALRNADY